MKYYFKNARLFVYGLSDCGPMLPQFEYLCNF